MSKQSVAKETQGYVAEFIPPTCQHCVHFKLDIVFIPACKPYNKEKNLRCTLGGFAVKKRGSCLLFAATP